MDKKTEIEEKIDFVRTGTEETLVDIDERKYDIKEDGVEREDKNTKKINARRTFKGTYGR
jgi:hypothetical protein